MQDSRPRLVLASASPRRRDLLAQAGIEIHDVRPSEIDETPVAREKPRDCALRLATAKAGALAAGPGEIILAADTIVSAGTRILGKPADKAEAERFLTLLSGRRHRVITGVAVRDDEKTRARVVETSVRLKRLSAEELQAYLASGEWQGKAGGYAIQGRAGAFVPWINGSYSNVVGLPLTETVNMLASAGIRPSSTT